MSGELLPARDDGVAIERIEFDEPGGASAGLCGDQGRARAPERIKDDVTPMRTVLDGVRDQGDRFDGRVHGKRLRPSLADTAHTGMIPHVGAVAASVAQPKSVDVRCGPNLEDEYQLVFGAVEGPHARVGLVPDHKVLQVGECVCSGIKQLTHMPPIHTHERDGAIGHL